MNGPKNHAEPALRKAEGFDEPLEIADFDIFEQGLDAWMEHALKMLKALLPERLPADFEEYLHRLEAYLERCDMQMRAYEALFDAEKFKSVSAALRDIRLDILARKIDPKFEEKFKQIRADAQKPK